MDDITLEDVPDELVRAILEALPEYYRISVDSRKGNARLLIREGPGGSHDAEVFSVEGHRRYVENG